MPRRISDYADAFAGWNMISSLGSIVSVIATWLFLHVLYTQLTVGKATSRYPWLTPQFYYDILQTHLSRSFNSLEWGLNSPPKPHAFVSLPVQSVRNDIKDLIKQYNKLDDELRAEKERYDALQTSLFSYQEAKAQAETLPSARIEDRMIENSVTKHEKIIALLTEKSKVNNKLLEAGFKKLPAKETGLDDQIVEADLDDMPGYFSKPPKPLSDSDNDNKGSGSGSGSGGAQLPGNDNAQVESSNTQANLNKSESLREPLESLRELLESLFNFLNGLFL